MNVLFISPTSMPINELSDLLDKSSIVRIENLSSPLGIMEIASYARSKTKIDEMGLIDYRKEVYDFCINRDDYEPIEVNDFLRRSIDEVSFTPDVVGISLMFSASHEVTMETCGIIRETWPNAVIIMGGSHASNFYKGLLDEDRVDYVARGEAEISFVTFLEEIGAGNRTFNIPGIYDQKKAQSSATEITPLINDLTEIPMPAFDLIDMDFYRDNQKDYGSFGVGMMMTRGCPFMCTFCASHTIHGRAMRYKSNEQILKEFDYLLNEAKLNIIVILDDLFAPKKKPFLELAESVSKIPGVSEGNLLFKIPSGLSVAVMDEDRVDAMLKMGIKFADVAVESGSPYVQKNLIKKNVNLDKARTLLAYMRKKNFYASVNMILGFPHETDSQRQESIDFMKSVDANWFNIFHAMPLPGAEIFDDFSQVMDIHAIDWEGVRYDQRKFDTDDISAAELEKLIYDNNIEINFLNNSNMRNGRYELAIEWWERYVIRPYPYHIVGRYCRAIAYLKLDKKDQCISEIEECLRWIETNPESKRLYDQYKDGMPVLRSLLECGSAVLDDKTNIELSDLDGDPSVEVTSKNLAPVVNGSSISTVATGLN